MQPIALYVHIPFCETKCPYCDFNTYAKIESLIPDYVATLRTEIELWGGLLDGPPVRTIFFGGGTPSYLPSGDISALMATISGSFTLQDDAEITLEANPGDFTSDKLNDFLDAGINRLSIGVQSFDDGLLRLLGRRHTAVDAMEAYRMAHDAGFDNVSIDLMYGLPHQTIDHWQKTLARTADLHPPHVSLYALTLEGGTPMEHSVAQGRSQRPTPISPPTCTQWPSRTLAHWATATTRYPTGRPTANWASTTSSTGATSRTWAWVQERIPLWQIIASPTSSRRVSTSRGCKVIPVP